MSIRYYTSFSIWFPVCIILYLSPIDNRMWYLISFSKLVAFMYGTTSFLHWQSVCSIHVLTDIQYTLYHPFLNVCPVFIIKNSLRIPQIDFTHTLYKNLKVFRVIKYDYRLYILYNVHIHYHYSIFLMIYTVTLVLQGDNSLKSVERFDHMIFVCRFQASRWSKPQREKLLCS
jgi:hypothetical protein